MLGIVGNELVVVPSGDEVELILLGLNEGVTLFWPSIDPFARACQDFGWTAQFAGCQTSTFSFDHQTRDPDLHKRTPSEDYVMGEAMVSKIFGFFCSQSCSCVPRAECFSSQPSPKPAPRAPENTIALLHCRSFRNVPPATLFKA
jgi:hypothetical protein